MGENFSMWYLCDYKSVIAILYVWLWMWVVSSHMIEDILQNKLCKVDLHLSRVKKLMIQLSAILDMWMF